MAKSSKYYVITEFVLCVIVQNRMNDYTFFGAVYLMKTRSAVWFQTVVMAVDHITVIGIWFLT